MAARQGLGNFIDGAFVGGGAIALKSHDPSRNFTEVFATSTNLDHVSHAVVAAKNAGKSWRYLRSGQRIAHLRNIKAAFIKNQEEMAQAISQEMGKILSEARAEAASLSARVDLMIDHGLARIRDEDLYDLRAQTRYHQQGTLAVIGPYNFPAHLMNAHVIPSILTGNTVVIKPSQVCPWVGEVYAKCVQEAKLPAGVVNMVQGDGAVGQALCGHPGIDGVLFTGSYATGRALQEMLIDQPHKILALELGGKNCVVVMDDAHLEQAVLEIIQGAFLTTGQRCTATSRVLAHDDIYATLKKALQEIIAQLRPVPASEPGMFGPLATQMALDKFATFLAQAKNEGARALVESRFLDGGAFVTPSLFEVNRDHVVKDYLGEELFGPNICLEPIKNLDHAIERINQSSFGLSNAIFTLNALNGERLYRETKCGVLNINRSTNGACGQMPFGGVNKSGNQRAAGIDAVRYATFPVAITALAYGESSAPADLKAQAKKLIAHEPSIAILQLRHEIESIFELYGVYPDGAAGQRLIFSTASFAGLSKHQEEFFAELSRAFGGAFFLDDAQIVLELNRISDAQSCLDAIISTLEKFFIKSGLSFQRRMTRGINIPKGLQIPRSRAMLDRLYHDNFVPKEKKASVIDFERSRGTYLASVDDDPLVLFDAASQIATVGAGFYAAPFQDAYESGALDESILENCDLSLDAHDEAKPAILDAKKARADFEAFLYEKSRGKFKSIGYGAGGSEANEIAFDLCRQNGPGGTKIIVFEGSFHGRTIMSLHATYNKEKSGPFIFDDYKAAFLPFPTLLDPSRQPATPSSLLAELEQGLVPDGSGIDAQLDLELQSLRTLLAEVKRGNVCCVIIEPMQCEGGDRYASNRFFNCLRALTRGLGVPLIFDEVQTGFNLGRTFFWHDEFDLRSSQGMPESPDCVTLGKRAQMGVCLSRFANPRTYTPHVVQLKRGLIHGQAILEKAACAIENTALRELKRLCQYFPTLVLNPRACGFAFAFDMPTNALAMELINQRFNYGFMAYIAGEKTLRFRLNMATDDAAIDRLFEKLFVALIDLRDQNVCHRIPKSSEKPNSDLGVSNICFEDLTARNFNDFVHEIEVIEEKAYEPGRRDTMSYLLDWLKEKDSVGIIMRCQIEGEEHVGGYAIGGPLEHITVDGPNEDSLRSAKNTFYSANITINERLRGLGFGTMMKAKQIEHVANIKNSDGSDRYSFISSRNRVDEARTMTAINESFNAYLVKTYEGQYGSPEARAHYFRLPLRKVGHGLSAKKDMKMIDCQNSIHTPFAQAPEGLRSALKNNYFRSLACTKLTLSNWATPNLIRYSELLRAFMPQNLHHAYFTSGRDETVDKGLRSLRFHRPKAHVAIGFSHQWLGNVTASARSLSHDEGQQQPFGFFAWPKVAHPGIVGHEKSLQELRTVLEKHPPETILGIVVELVGERSGLTFDEAYLRKLATIRQDFGVPLVFVENASAFGRSGKTLFLSDTLSPSPNMVWWFTGGQLGHVFVDHTYFVEKPLTLISTWDGDDISILRAYYNLLAANAEQWRDDIAHFSSRLAEIKGPYERSGLGLWNSFRIRDPKKLLRMRSQAKEMGLLFGAGFDNSLMVCPKLDAGKLAFDKIAEGLQRIFNE